MDPRPATDRPLLPMEQDTDQIPAQQITVLSSGKPVPNMFERSLAVTKNIIVIITCIVILYTAYVVYSGLAELGRNLQQIPGVGD